MEVLIDHARRNPNWESVKAEAMFKKFLSDGFLYDEISSHPDYPSYASAVFLLDMIPWIIDEMLHRKDIGNFLIYKILSAIDLEGSEIPEYQERTKQLVALASQTVEEKVCRFLDALKNDPPIERKDFDRVYGFWKKKSELLQNLQSQLESSGQIPTGE